MEQDSKLEWSSQVSLQKQPRHEFSPEAMRRTEILGSKICEIKITEIMKQTLCIPPNRKLVDRWLFKIMHICGSWSPDVYQYMPRYDSQVGPGKYIYIFIIPLIIKCLTRVAPIFLRTPHSFHYKMSNAPHQSLQNGNCRTYSNIWQWI